MSIKGIMRQNDIIRKIVKKRNIKKELRSDYKLFVRHYNDSFKETCLGNEYKIMLIVHSLEKGMCFKKPRPFGAEKIKELLTLMKTVDHSSTSAKMGYSIIVQWLKRYEENGFEKDCIYEKAKKFATNNDGKYEMVDVGAFDYKPKEEQLFRYDNFLKGRHSVREYLNEPIRNDDINYAILAALYTPTACNRQMVKIYKISSSKKKELLDNIIIGLSGFEKKNNTYFVVSYDLSAFSYYGERSQGLFNAGLVSMNFVNALHDKRVGSCFLQWGNDMKEEKKAKKIIGIPSNEKIAVVIAAGYYKNVSRIPKSHRKERNEIYKEL